MEGIKMSFHQLNQCDTITNSTKNIMLVFQILFVCYTIKTSLFLVSNLICNYVHSIGYDFPK